MKSTPKMRIVELLNGNRPFKEILQERFDAGLSPRQLQDEFGMHWTLICKRARQLGVPTPRLMQQAEREDEELIPA